MRAFVAIDLPEGTRVGAAAVQSRLKDAGVDASWPRPDSLHLTLKFLGETDNGRTDEILSALTAALVSTSRFRLDIQGVGAFPDPTTARVVWLGVGGEVEKLFALHAAVDRTVAGLGFTPEERPYTPHLTLGRIRRIRDRDAWRQALARVGDFKIPGFEVAAVGLFRSELRPGGAVHHSLGAAALRQDPG